MSDKKKKVTAVVAVATATALFLGGTFAWQSISQTALNEKDAVINPGGRLHDDFNGSNKDVYVENFADEPIFARVRLDEYFEITMNKNTPAETTEVITTGASKDDKSSYLTHYFDQTNLTDEYWDWATGGSTKYMPTFNKNKDSLKADINGTYENDYSDYVEYIDGEELTADATYDNDSNDVEDDGVVKVEETHYATETGTANLISIEEWLALEDDTDNYWVYDTDGWVYWSSPIQAGTATGLLLDGISLKNKMDDSYYYAINVTGQFVTADDIGKSDSTGFYDTEAGTVPSDEAEKLLRAIGVDMGEEPVVTPVSYSIDITDTAIFGSNNATGISVALKADGTSVSEGVTWNISSENAVVDNGYIKPAETVNMASPLEKYTVTAFVNSTEVASNEFYMFDSSYYSFLGVATSSDGNVYYGFDYEGYEAFGSGIASEFEKIQLCTYRLGDNISEVYFYNEVMNFYFAGMGDSFDNYYATPDSMKLVTDMDWDNINN